MTTLIPASCHCGKNKYLIPFKTSTLPKAAAMCHCNTCRHSTGSMSVVDYVVDGAPLSPDATEDNHIPGDLSNLTEYRSPKFTRLFCNTCSAHAFIRIDAPASPPIWTVHWGMLEKTDGVVSIDKHIFLGDTIDGGIANNFTSFAGTPLPRLKGADVEGAREPFPAGCNTEGGYKNPETLSLYCHCKSVNLYLTRPAKLSDNPEVYWLVPGKEPTDPIRLIAAHCLCNSCRQTSGGQIQSWIVVPNENIFDSSTKEPVNLTNSDKRPNALKQYASSEGKYRESCGTCGATVFWWKPLKEGEPQHMDVSVGLIDQDGAGGARAESWIMWYGQAMNEDSAVSAYTVESVKEGLVKACEGN